MKTSSETGEHRARECATFERIGSGAEFIEQNECASSAHASEYVGDVCHVRAERAEISSQRLFVTDVGEDLGEDKELTARVGGNGQTSLRCEHQQPDSFDRYGFSASIRASDDHDLGVLNRDGR